MGRSRGQGRGRGERNRGPAHSDEDGLDASGRGASKGASGSARFGRDDHASSGKMPKFLQPYAHLLEKGNKRSRPARIQSDEDDDGQDDQGAADAMMRALDEQPELKLDLEMSQVKRMHAEAAKERGNDSFKAKDFHAAVQHYNEAILADNTNAAYYSNRSAAHAALEQWEEARSDGARAANLRPTWTKAWTRLGAALMGLHDYAEAKDAYSKAMELEPDDKTINNAWLKADYEERQASQAGRLAFNRRKLKGASAAVDPAASGCTGQSTRRTKGSGRASGAGTGGKRMQATAGSGCRGGSPGQGHGRRDPDAVDAKAVHEPAPKKARRPMLSFGDDSDEDEA